MLSVIYADCQKQALYAEYHNDECHCAECRYAKYRGAFIDCHDLKAVVTSQLSDSYAFFNIICLQYVTK